MTITARDLMARFPVSNRDIENWDKRGILTSSLSETKQGCARVFTRKHAVEIALLAVFVRAGFTPASARPMIDPYLNGPPAHGSLVLFIDGQPVPSLGSRPVSGFVNVTINIGAVHRSVAEMFDKAGRKVA